MQKFTNQKLAVTFTTPTGTPGRPVHQTINFRIPSRRGPISGRVHKLLQSRRIPAAAKVVKIELI